MKIPAMKKTIRNLSIGALLMCAMLLTGCVAGNNASSGREYKVLCGLSSKNGEVSEDAWKRFCDKHVSAAFPDGYTVLDATGYWRSGQNATAKERSKVILVIAPADAREKVLSVARQFQKEFSQEFVLISSSDAEVEGVSAKDASGR